MAMAKLKFSKSSLAQHRSQLQLYEKLLPSLDLKRRQVTLELERAKRSRQELRAVSEQLDASIGQSLPMLAQDALELSGLVAVTSVELTEENVVGVRLPKLAGVSFEVAEYSRLAQPAWVDVLVLRLQEAIELRMRCQVVAERVRRLERAVRRVTQRVNLFERILIPTTKRNIERIQIVLADLERDAVVRSKLVKARRQSMAEEGLQR
jgi:V/A-type H+-transporting ATPase subunit D